MGFLSNLFKKEKEVYSPVDYNRVFDNTVIDGIPVERLDIGLLNVPTGQIIVCDPLVFSDAQPFTKTVAPGKYPVTIYIAKTPDAGDRYAVACLEIKPGRAEKWVLALTKGQDTSQLKNEGDYFGFPVDAGLGGFLDSQTAAVYDKFLDDFQKNNPNSNIYDDFFAAEFKKNAADQDDPNDIGDWVNFTFPGTDLNITMFHSGYGDGMYPAYWGTTNDEEIVSLVIDFMVLFGEW
ncbi:DUF4241 domain-containing protein [Mucilaginibacter celer]|uniref:DUF4241 domain-containing protein n=1 Tax=Mucilaginibacter celer TaxID=2305508 RepID=A0A494VWW4_9SPHI|nr:DUF4241 domain-containing protein [Mucilaginibacter celer]AYL95808.1 DUF4241 domain-containing protein [Mucilaginibacter celer]